MQSDGGDGCVIPLFFRADVQKFCRKLPQRLSRCDPSAPQNRLGIHAVAHQDQRLPPTQGQLVHRFPGIPNGDPRWWRCCPDFFASVAMKNPAGSGSPFIDGHQAGIQMYFCQSDSFRYILASTDGMAFSSLLSITISKVSSSMLHFKNSNASST